MGLIAWYRHCLQPRNYHHHRCRLVYNFFLAWSPCRGSIIVSFLTPAPTNYEYRRRLPPGGYRLSGQSIKYDMAESCWVIYSRKVPSQLMKAFARNKFENSRQLAFIYCHRADIEQSVTYTTFLSKSRDSSLLGSRAETKTSTSIVSGS